MYGNTFRNVNIALVKFDPHVHGIDSVSMEEAVQDADLLLVLVEHDEFKHLDHAWIASKMRHPVLFDTRNMIMEQPNSGMTYINYGSMFRWKDESNVS